MEILNWVIEVTARCTQAEKITQITNVNYFQPSGGIPRFMGFWPIIGASTIISLVLKNKKLRK